MHVACTLAVCRWVEATVKSQYNIAGLMDEFIKGTRQWMVDTVNARQWRSVVVAWEEPAAGVCVCVSVFPFSRNPIARAMKRGFSGAGLRNGAAGFGSDPAREGRVILASAEGAGCAHRHG